MVVASKKQDYFKRLERLFDEYDKFFLVNADHVGSKQLQELRITLRKTSEILMGKNTMMRKAIRGMLPKHPELDVLIPKLVGNVGLVFTKGDLKEIRDTMENKKVPAAAKAGTIAQCDVTIPAGPTGMEPTMTAFFQVLNIPTKINKGQIEILSDVHILKEGEKVGSSEVALLQKMGVTPFSYALKVLDIMETGYMFSPKVLDISSDDIKNHMIAGLNNIAAVSLAADYPTAASLPHSLANGFQNLMYVALGSGVSFKHVEKVKDILDNPEALAALAASAAPAAGAAAAGAPAAEEKKVEEEEEEETGFDLFD
jgi:large subunit ribosomal protein LP0